MRFEEAPDLPPEGMPAPGWEKKVMLASITIGESMIMMSGQDDGGFNGFRLSIAPENEEEAARILSALSEGGSIEMPLGRTF